MLILGGICLLPSSAWEVACRLRNFALLCMIYHSAQAAPAQQLATTHTLCGEMLGDACRFSKTYTFVFYLPDGLMATSNLQHQLSAGSIEMVVPPTRRPWLNPLHHQCHWQQPPQLRGALSCHLYCAALQLLPVHCPPGHLMACRAAVVAVAAAGACCLAALAWHAKLPRPHLHCWVCKSLCKQQQQEPPGVHACKEQLQEVLKLLQ